LLYDLALHPLAILVREAVTGRQFVQFAVTPKYHRIMRITERRRRLDQRVEDWLQIKCRAADDLEHVGSRGLLLQRLAQLL
jgi:hypothetical protein